MGKRALLMAAATMAGSSINGISAAADPLTARQTDEDAVAGLTEIVVTATRRPTYLEQTPIAITAFSGAEIDRQHTQDFSNLASVAPSLVFTAQSRQEAYPSIRGTTVGNDAPGSDLGVSVFIDDVPTTGVGDNDPNLFDLQSIEVLRGPQGTLFGRNVTGGALVVHTLPPDFTAHEKAELTYGNYNLAEGRGYVTGPLIDNTLAGKITFDVRRQDGFIDNRFLHDTTVSTRLWGTRAQLLWTPSDDLRVLAGVDYNSDTSPYKVQQLIGNFQPASFPPLSYGPSDTDQGVNATGDSKTSGGFIRADYTMPVGILTSITGYRHADSRDFFSTSAEPFNEILQAYHVGADQLTEEIHFASPADRRFSWVTGLFFLNSNREGLKHYNLNVQPNVLAGVAAPPYTALQFIADNNQHVHAHSYAVFGEANYAFTPAWKLTLGGRFTKEDKSGHSEVYDTSALSSQGLATPFQPEKVVSYELGIKVTAFDKRLIVNAAAYYAKYTELQVQEFQNLQYVTGNAGVANIPGFELEGTFNALSWLTLMGNYS